MSVVVGTVMNVPNDLSLYTSTPTCTHWLVLPIFKLASAMVPFMVVVISWYWYCRSIPALNKLLNPNSAMTSSVISIPLVLLFVLFVVDDVVGQVGHDRDTGAARDLQTVRATRDVSDRKLVLDRATSRPGRLRIDADGGDVLVARLRSDVAACRVVHFAHGSRQGVLDVDDLEPGIGVDRLVYRRGTAEAPAGVANQMLGVVAVRQVETVGMERGPGNWIRHGHRCSLARCPHGKRISLLRRTPPVCLRDRGNSSAGSCRLARGNLGYPMRLRHPRAKRRLQGGIRKGRPRAECGSRSSSRRPRCFVGFARTDRFRRGVRWVGGRLSRSCARAARRSKPEPDRERRGQAAKEKISHGILPIY